jgi:hypothetical protein
MGGSQNGLFAILERNCQSLFGWSTKVEFLCNDMGYWFGQESHGTQRNV